MGNLLLVAPPHFFRLLAAILGEHNGYLAAVEAAAVHLLARDLGVFLVEKLDEGKTAWLAVGEREQGEQSLY